MLTRREETENKNLYGTKMANGSPRKVVFKKPRLEIPSKITPNSHPKPIDKPEPVKEPEPEEEPQEIIKTKSNRTIIIKREPLHSRDTVIFEDEPEPAKTFDERFIDNLDIKSRITKDTITQNKIKKQEIKPTRKVKKPKRKDKYSIIISFILFICTVGLAFKSLSDFLNNKLDQSLASFMYVVSISILSVIMLFWFGMEISKEDVN